MSDLTGLLVDQVLVLDVAGASIALAQGDELAAACSGLADPISNQAVTPETTFAIGSTTKAMTAALLVVLASQSLVDLDRPVSDYLPSLRLSDPEAEMTLTSRHLLSHTSGIDNGPYLNVGAEPDAVGRYVARLAELPHLHPPGERFGYSNAAYILAGRVVEAASGLDFDTALTRTLLRPIGVEPLIDYHPGSQRGHSRTADHWTALPTTGLRGMMPAGVGLAMTPTDLVQFGRLILNRGRAGDGTQVMATDLVGEMLRPHAYLPAHHYAAEWCGLGWFGSAELVSHAGGTMAGVSFLALIPDQDVAVAVTANHPGVARYVVEAVTTFLHDTYGTALRARAIPIEGPPPDDPDHLVGHYRQYGAEHNITRDEQGLAMTTHHAAGLYVPQPVTETAPLKPIQSGSYLYTHATGLEKVVTFDPIGERAEYLYNGHFLARRTPGASQN